jgi:20S proteasome subunit beta 1
MNVPLFGEQMYSFVMLDRIRERRPTILSGRALIWRLIAVVLTASMIAPDCSENPAIRSFGVSAAIPAAIDLGTTIVAVKFDKGVVVGADTRTSSGGVYVSHATAHKIVPLTSHAVVARSGSAAITQHLAESAYNVQQSRFLRYDQTLSVSQLAHWLRATVYELQEKQQELSLGLLVVGYDLESQQARIFSIPASGALIEEKGNYAAEGSGSRFALGYLDQCYQQISRLKDASDAGDARPTEEAAVDLCRQAIEGSILRDGSSGGLIRLYILTAKGRREVTVVPHTTDAQSNDEERSDDDDDGGRGGNRRPLLSGFAAATLQDNHNAVNTL